MRPPCPAPTTARSRWCRARWMVEPTDRLDPIQTGTLLERLAAYHLGWGNPDAAHPAASRALELLPVEPPSVARAQAQGILAHALGLQSHFDESNRLAEEALANARLVGSAEAEIRALGCIGRNRRRGGRCCLRSSDAAARSGARAHRSETSPAQPRSPSSWCLHSTGPATSTRRAGSLMRASSKAGAGVRRDYPTPCVR